MIQTTTFNLLLAAALLMFLYAVIDHRNRLYANIVIIVASAITFAYLGEAISIGVVTGGTSTSTGFLLKLLSTLAFGYSIFMAYDVIDEQLQKNAIAKQNGEQP